MRKIIKHKKIFSFMVITLLALVGASLYSAAVS